MEFAGIEAAGDYYTTIMDCKFLACLCQKALKYIQYSCAFLASAVEKFARQSAHFGYWYSFHDHGLP